MKKNTINQSTITDSLVMALGVAGGVALSGSLKNLAKAYLPTDFGDEIGQVGVAGLGLLGSAMVKPDNKDDKLGQAVKALAIGVAAKSAYDLVSKAVTPSITVKPTDQRTAMDHVLYGAVGLGCACQSNSYGHIGMNAALPVNPIVEFAPIEPDTQNEYAALLGEADQVEAASLM